MVQVAKCGKFYLEETASFFNIQGLPYASPIQFFTLQTFVKPETRLDFGFVWFGFCQLMNGETASWNPFPLGSAEVWQSTHL